MKHNNQSFNDPVATNKPGHCKHLGCRLQPRPHLTPWPTNSSSLQTNSRYIEWAIYIIISLTHLYRFRSYFWPDPIDHNVSIIIQRVRSSNKLQSFVNHVCYPCSIASTMFCTWLAIAPQQLPYVYSQFDQPQIYYPICWYDLKDQRIVEAIESYAPWRIVVISGTVHWL